MVTDLQKIKFKKGDYLKLNINVYTYDGTFVKEVSKDNFELILGQNNYIPEFDDLLIEQEFNKVFEVVKHFSTDYKIEKLKGQSIKFIIEVKEYEEAKNVKNDIELKELKKEYENYKETTKGAIEMYDEQKAKTAKITALVDQLKSKIESLTKDLKSKEEFLDKRENELKKALKGELKKGDVKLDEKLEKEKEEKPEIKVVRTIPKEEQERVKKFALQKFFEEFLNPYSTLKQAVSGGLLSKNDNVKNYVKGFQMVINLIERVFSDFGLKEINPEVGSEFNPNNSKIIDFEIDDNKKPNTVVSVNSIGYMLYERSIKPAVVVATKYSPEKEKEIKAKEEKISAEKAQKEAQEKADKEAKKEKQKEKANDKKTDKNEEQKLEKDNKKNSKSNDKNEDTDDKKSSEKDNKKNEDKNIDKKSSKKDK